MKKNYLSKLFLAVCAALSFQSAFALDSSNADLTCKYTYKFRDTFSITRQDRPVTVTKTDQHFGFGWSARENYTKAKWEFTVDLTDAQQVNVRLRQVKYDDSMNIYVNGQQIFNGYRNGYKGYDANLDVGRFFSIGKNTITVELVNDIAPFAEISAMFDYSEGGCKTNGLPLPPIKALNDNTRCTESLVCTEPKETRIIGNGMPITRDCWNWETKRLCYDFLEDQSTCSIKPPSSDQTCQVLSKTCLEQKQYELKGNTFQGCTLYETKYQCTQPVDPNKMSNEDRQAYLDEMASRKSLCKPVQTCIGDNCYKDASERDDKDGDMPMVLALLQVGQQAGTYMDAKNMRVFNGVASKCRSKRGFGALAPCCDVNSPVSDQSNKSAFAKSNAISDQRYTNPNTSYSQDYTQGGSNPYTYDSLYKPNESTYMLSGTSAMKDTDAGGYGITNGGASTITMMGYGYSTSGTSTGDQQTFIDYSKTENKGTSND